MGGCLAAPQTHPIQFVGQISSIKTENIRQGDISAAFGVGPAAAVHLAAGYYVKWFRLKTLKHVFISKLCFYYLGCPNRTCCHAQKVPFTLKNHTKK